MTHPPTALASDQRLLNSLVATEEELGIVGVVILAAAEDSVLTADTVRVQNIRIVLSLVNLVDAQLHMQVRENLW